jgi:hypothetical protein
VKSLVLLSLSAVCAAGYTVSPRPKFFMPADYVLDARPTAGQASEGLYWLLSDEQEDVATHSHFRHYARRVLSASGLAEVSEISVAFDPAYEKLMVHRITLWRKGMARELLPRLRPTWLRREEDWDDWGMLDGRKTLLFALEDVRVGDVVEFSYTLRGDNPIFGGKSAGMLELQYGVPVDRLRVRLRHPAARAIHLTLRGGAGADAEAGKPVATREGGDEVLTWERTQVPPHLDEDDAPDWYAPNPQVEWSEYSSWEEVVAWALDLYALDKPLSPELRRFVDALRPLPPRDRIRGALRMVQDEVRYLGMEMGSSSHKPAHPNAVYARRFGDCKDKALLFCALMRELGLPAAPVLVNTGARKETPGFQPSPLAFDHVIARVRFEGKPYWFDATLTHQGGDPLATQCLPYGKGLAIEPGNGGFEDIEMRDADKARVRVREHLSLPAWDSSAVLTVTTDYEGAEAEDVRYQFAQDSRDRLDKENLNFHARNYPRIRALEGVRIADDTAANRVTVTETYAVDSLCAIGSTGRRECSLWPEEVAGWVEAPERSIRNSPYALTYPKNVEEEIVLDAPERVPFNDGKRAVDHPDFSFTWRESQQGKRITLSYAYSARADHVPLERFPAYARAIGEIRDNLGATLYPGSGAWFAFARLNFPLLFLCAGWLVAGLWAARSLRWMDAGQAVRAGPSDQAGSAAPGPPIGWPLVLLGLTMAVAPIARLAMLQDVAHLFDLSAWNELTAEAGHPWRIPLLLADLSVELVIACASLGLWPLFLKRRRAFRKAYLLVNGAAAALGGLYLGATAVSGDLLVHATEARGRAFILGNLAVSLLWLAYVSASRRVEAIFKTPRAP